MVNSYNTFPELDIHIGKRLREKRKKFSMTLVEAAKQLGISHQQLQKYETAESRLSVSLLYCISRLYRLPLSYFYQGFKEKGLNSINLLETIKVNRKKSFNVLVLEHDPNDELLINQALFDTDKNIRIFCLRNGDQAMEHLIYKNLSVEFPKPDIILMNWDLPGRDAESILKSLKRDPDLQSIPVIIISHIAKNQSVCQSYKNFAAGYIYRDTDDNFKKLIKGAIHYWSKIVILSPPLIKSYL